MKDLSQEEKGALLLKSLATPVMENVLAKLEPERRNHLRALMQRLPEAPSQETLEQFLREVEKLLPRQAAGPAPKTAAEKPVQASNAPDGAARQVSKEVPLLIQDPLGELTKLDAEQLAATLQGENPRIVFLLLNHFPVDRAGQLFKRLPGDLRREVSMQFNSPTLPGIEVLQQIAQGVLRKSRLLKETPPEPTAAARYRKMADMLRVLERAERKEVVTALEERDPEAAAAVKSHLYLFEDLLRIENRSMQKLLAELDTKNLALSLKGASPAIQEKVLSNMSQRAQETVKEEMEFSGTIAAAVIQQAQKVIVDTIQRLDQAGELVMTQE